MSDDESAEELARLWIEKDELNWTLFPDYFDEPADWGSAFALMAKSVVETLAEQGGDRAALLAAIREAFTDELAE